MKKRVNGRTVDIKNIEIFEKAAGSLAINRTATSNTSDTSGIDSKNMGEIVKLYTAFYKSLPYPLYAIDEDIKYSTIATFIKKRLVTPPKMWISNRLYVILDEESKIAVNFVNLTWGIVKVDNIKDDNTDITEYNGACGFEDFVWALTKILKKQSTSSYYKEFMPEFIEACNNQPMVLKWELSNILEFGLVHDKMEFPDNKIVDLDTGNTYFLDIFVTGLRETKKKQCVLSLISDGDMETKHKYVKQYGFDAYEKISTADMERVVPNSDKLKKKEMYGLTGLFNILCAIKNVNEHETFDSYKGFTADGNLAFIVNSRLFIAKANKFVEPKEIARGVELYSYNRGIMYFSKRRAISKGIKEETIYSYSFKDGNLRLCRIGFVDH